MMPYRHAGDRLLLPFGKAIARIVYRVIATGLESLPKGGFLLLPNHITWVDAIVLLLAARRPIRFVIDEQFYRNRFLHSALRAVGCIPINQKRPREAIRLAAEQICAGEIVCLFPEGQLSRSGTLLRLRRGYELIARQAEAPVVPVWLDQLWGSIFSFQGGRFFTKWPRRVPYYVRVAFGKPLAPDQADIATVREELLKLGEFCFSQRPNLQQHLAVACLRGLKHHPFRTAITDGLDGSSLPCAKLLGAAIALARHIERHYPERRIGIVMPPSKGGVVANLAVVLARKIPVNFNFTSARESIESALEQSGVTTILSARLVRKRFEDFPWPAGTIYVDEILPPMKAAIICWWLCCVILPARFLERILRLPRVGDRAEALLLFTSGSSGKPKGVALTHRNIIANVSQFRVLLDSRPSDRLLASLPLFHSFGATVTLWYPLIEGVATVTYPNPLDAAKIAELIKRYAITIILATPTFLRAYLRKAERADLRSLRLVITGAEKLPDDLAKAFEERFDKAVMQGYGLTETSPVVSVNLPDPTPSEDAQSIQPSSRLGSTGKLAPGIAAEIRDAETDEKLSLHDTGMLWLRGPNIFEGYLGDPKRSAEVLREGWFKTGDLGRFDEDGFLYIDGRLSRFSKIGGEMVPHEVVEAKVVAALGLVDQSDRVIAVIGVPDETKGEALILLSSIDVDLATLRSALSEMGVPNLWIPRTVRRVEAIPVLASGKLNLAKCREAVIA